MTREERNRYNYMKSYVTEVNKQTKAILSRSPGRNTMDEYPTSQDRLQRALYGDRRGPLATLWGNKALSIEEYKKKVFEQRKTEIYKIVYQINHTLITPNKRFHARFNQFDLYITLEVPTV